MGIQDVEDYIKSIGYTELKKAASNRLIVYMDGSERVSALKSIASDLGGRYTSSKNGIGWRSSVGAALLSDNIVVLAKPITTGTTGNIASLDARQFSKLGKSTKYEFADQKIDSVVFTSAKQIEQSIIEGCRSSSMLGEGYAEAFEDFFATGNISWSPTMPRPVINKLGVYIGELLVGWTFLSNKKNKYFANDPFSGAAVAFYLPTDPAFSGVDSFVELRDKSFYAISSKFGGGAKASFFTNLFDKGIQKRAKLSKSYFKDMCDFAATNNISSNKSKEFIYNFGIKHMLQISSKEVPTPTDVFDNIRLSKDTNEVNFVASKIKELSKEQRIVKDLPNSVSAYFNRTIADELNKDRASVNQMREILAGKDYWQANLDINYWVRGIVKFKFINSGEASLSIIGSKSAITDITSKQGWVNYELKY